MGCNLWVKVVENVVVEVEVEASSAVATIYGGLLS